MRQRGIKNEEFATGSELVFLQRLVELNRSRKYGAMRHLINLRIEQLTKGAKVS